jgi:signal transduction histidine kinase
MSDVPGLTVLAPATRAPADVVQRQAGSIASLELMRAVLDASPSPTMVVNRCRQIVYSNLAAAAFFGAAGAARIFGSRPGEALDCVHAGENEGRCGTAEACRYCGALLCLTEALAGRPDSRECRITRRRANRGEPLDLLLSATPLTVDGEPFAIVSLLDISDQKRRRALERIFFHDVLNTAATLEGLAGAVVRQAGDGGTRLYAEALRDVSRQLVNEILSQRTLLAAESDELTAEPSSLGSLSVVREEVQRFASFPAFSERIIEIDPASVDIAMVSDRVLLGRVLGNMIRNALEATPAGSTVRVGCRPYGGSVEFWVWNPGGMPRDVQLQIFQRSFSTKGGGRGLGTYGMKLLTERYLAGAVSFDSSEERGTEFRARYPRMLRTPNSSALSARA